jgi:DNA-binding transcriptional regulator GbsR (MarR family)
MREAHFHIKILEDLGLVKRIVIPGDKRHIYAPIIDSETIMTNMLDTINKEIQLFCEALEETENELTDGGDEVRYLRERVAMLKYSYEQGKKKIDLLREQSLNEIHECVGVNSEKPHSKSVSILM